MEVIACIPQLPHREEAVPSGLEPAVVRPAVIRPAVIRPAVIRPAVVQPAVVQPAVVEPAVIQPAVIQPAVIQPAVIQPAAPVRGRSKEVRFPAPTIIVLAAVAIAFWMAAFRNDRLRLEVANQQRPERLARELPATAGTERSPTP